MATSVVRSLRDEIVAGDLLPNERIKQDAVAKRFGVSRLPVREALRELASDGLVVLERDVGARVAALDPRELVEIFLLRETLEPLVVREATTRLTGEELTAIEELNSKSEPFAREDDAAGYMGVDAEFHRRIFTASEMNRACTIIGGLWQTANRYRHAYSILPHRLEISVIEHRMILEAIRRGAAEDASELHRVHIRRTRLTLAGHPELFPDGPNGD